MLLSFLLVVLVELHHLMVQFQHQVVLLEHQVVVLAKEPQVPLLMQQLEQQVLHH